MSEPAAPLGSYPRDCWYVAATSEEVRADLIARRVLDDELVLYRRADGSIVALEDRCAHRAYPLSLGRLDADRIVCGYHGWEYDGTGACTRVPSQAHVPFGTCVRAFPVREEPPFVWVWTGEEARAARRPPPEVSWLRSGDQPIWRGAIEIEAHFMLLHEAILDLTHLPFVYPEIAPTGLADTPPPLEVEVTETSVSYRRTFPATRLADWQSRATGIPPDMVCEQQESGEFVSPALWVGSWSFQSETDDGSRPLLLSMAYAFTPQGPTSTRVVWHGARDFSLDDDAAGRVLENLFSDVFHRRKALLEAVERRSGADAARREVNVTADVAALRARKIVEAMCREEQRS
jgi:vanillate O-demethylase monooxygenase subunit